MKISEVKEGKIRFAESKVAAGGINIREGTGIRIGEADSADFISYLSSENRVLWERLSDVKKKRVLKRVENSPEIRHYAWVLEEEEITRRKKKAAIGVGRSVENEEAVRKEYSAKITGSTQGGTQRKELASGSSAGAGSKASISARTQNADAVAAADSVKSVGNAASKAADKSKIAALAKKKAEKVTEALRKMSSRIEPEKKGTSAAASRESAAAEVSNLMKPVRKTLAAIGSMLAIVFGPIIFFIFLTVMIIVIIVFIVAWLISVLFAWVDTTASTQVGYGGAGGVMPYYCQQDPVWADHPYDAGNIFSYGCGPTSMAMIIACLKGDMSITPVTIADMGNGNIGRYGLSVSGTHAAPVNIASFYGIDGVEQMAGPSKNCCGVSKGYELSYIKNKIKEGCPVLVSVSGTYLNVSTQGHYFVLFGEGEKGVYIYDPATLGQVYNESISNGGSDWNAVLHDAKHIWIFPAPVLKVTGNTNAEKIFKYLVKAGWSKAAAAGAVGNMYQEAGGGGTADINPSSYDSGSWGQGGGIVGFTDNGDADNFTALKNYAKTKGKQWQDLEVQCEFLIYQMSHGTWWGGYATPTYRQMTAAGYSVPHMTYQEFIQLQDVEMATRAFLCFYEDCGMAQAHYEDVRLPMAHQAYAAWGK